MANTRGQKTSLIVLYEDAKALLDSAVFEGQTLLDKPVLRKQDRQLMFFDTDERFTACHMAYVKWARTVCHVLTDLFSDRSIAEEFGSPSPWSRNGLTGSDEIAASLAGIISYHVASVESIRDRLQFYPVTTDTDTGNEDIELGDKSRDGLSCRKVFVVHGHNQSLKNEVELFLRELEINPIILHKQPDEGRTIIEKLEKYGNDACFAIVLLTADDFGGLASEKDVSTSRARQNVILELGYFLALIGRKRVRALYEEGVELPTDFDGVVYTMLGSQDWKKELAREMHAAGVKFDTKKLLDT